MVSPLNGQDIIEVKIFALKQSLELAREQSGVSKRAFALALGIDPPLYWHWLNGKRRFGKDALERIRAKYPEYVPDDLIEAARLPGYSGYHTKNNHTSK